MSQHGRYYTGTLPKLQRAVESFVASCGQPALSEPGEELIELTPETLSLTLQNGHLLLQAWDQRRNLARKVTAIEAQTRSKLVLRVERFGKKTGTLALLDLKRPGTENASIRSARLEFREVFRRFLQRHYTGFKIAELSTEANLEQTLSPAYPRALLLQGSSAWAAIGCGPEADPGNVLSFGLIWLDYLRRRDPMLTVGGLILLLPEGQEYNTCLRLRFLSSACATYSVFAYSEDGHARSVDLADYGNILTQLDPCLHDPEFNAPPELAAFPGIEAVRQPQGALSYRVRGLEFARFAAGQLSWGLETKRTARASNLCEIRALAGELVRLRSPDAQDRQHPLYLKNRESWLESQVRAHVEEIDATLFPAPIYGQVPAFAAGDRGVLDLVAVSRSGRLAVIELKATPDIHLPLQALDYWIRVKWHLDRREFTAQGYFPGTQLAAEAPKLLLVAPALEFHPSNERILRFFSPTVPVERMGVGLEWQKQLKLMYRM